MDLDEDVRRRNRRVLSWFAYLLTADLETKWPVQRWTDARANHNSLVSISGMETVDRESRSLIASQITAPASTRTRIQWAVSAGLAFSGRFDDESPIGSLRISSKLIHKLLGYDSIIPKHGETQKRVAELETEIEYILDRDEICVGGSSYDVESLVELIDDTWEEIWTANEDKAFESFCETNLWQDIRKLLRLPVPTTLGASPGDSPPSDQ